MDAILERRILRRLGRKNNQRVDASPTNAQKTPASLDPHIITTLKSVYGNGVLKVSSSTVNKDGQIEGVFVGRSRPTASAKVYRYGIDLVKQSVRFKRAANQDSDDDEGCGCEKCQGKSRSDADLSGLERNGDGEVKYQGRWWTPNKPVSSTAQGKKKMVLAVKDGKVKIVHFGATGYGNNYSESARASYLARSAGITDKNGNATKGDRHSPNYWARTVLWAGKGGAVTPKGDEGPCWEGYEQRGVKRKGGKIVPNCVPTKKL